MFCTILIPPDGLRPKQSSRWTNSRSCTNIQSGLLIGGRPLETAAFEAGNYRYIRGPFQYSGGVAAEQGYAIERVRFSRPLPMVEGFRASIAPASLAQSTATYIRARVTSASALLLAGFPAAMPPPRHLGRNWAGKFQTE